MSLSLEQLRAAFKKPDGEGGERRQNNYFPFWNIKEGQTATVRFIPDKNKNNPFGFLVEKIMHPLTINGEKKSVPCLTMYGETCPICKVSSAFFKDEGKDSVNGKKYWRKAQQIAQALVIEDPLPADEATGETHQGKLRFLALGKQIADVIKEGLGNPDLEENPTHYDGGYDFIIKKTMKDKYAQYTVGSRFRGKARALTDEERDVVDAQQIDLSTLLPPKPDLEKVEQMLEAALTGGDYSEDDKPVAATPAKILPARVAVTRPIVEDDSDNDDTPPVDAGLRKVAPKPTAPKVEEVDDETESILASIRNRKKASVE